MAFVAVIGFFFASHHNLHLHENRTRKLGAFFGRSKGNGGGGILGQKIWIHSISKMFMSLQYFPKYGRLKLVFKGIQLKI